MQRNWIGRSEGAEVDFEVAANSRCDGNNPVFTTRPDTLFGATYMVLAPEHKLVEKITTAGQQGRRSKHTSSSQQEERSGTD